MNVYKNFLLWTVISVLVFFYACSDSSESINDEDGVQIEQSAISIAFNGRIDMDNLPNYANQEVPSYITKDNTGNNEISDEGAVLGRVLFYDVNLSSNNTIACASCHQQSAAFGDRPQASLGVNGSTGRHSMRLINSRFADEERFFWDERAATLEAQTTQPIQDHIEMGFSGQEGDQSIDDLIEKLQQINYYQELFDYAFGDENITEARMQEALAQFIRSIQSFDSRYDAGRAQADNDGANFNNFSAIENLGKQLFLGRPVLNNNGIRVNGGLGCSGCHRAPEFDIDPGSNNNGVIGSINGEGVDTEVTRSPTLRDLFDNNGNINGSMMHTGDMNDLMTVLEHYNLVNDNNNNNLDRRLTGRNLAMTDEEMEAVAAFIGTLSGNDVYTNEKWSNPF